jgi:hypothetical protein
MKKLFIFFAGSVLALIISCEDPYRVPTAQKTISVTPAADEHLMNEVSHGLHKIRINDSTTVLLYRGVESCTMIQIK